MHKEFTVRVPGSTSNLGAGFDTLGLALQIYLKVKVSTDTEKLQITTNGDGAGELPHDETNMVYEMYKKGCEFLGVQPKPLRLEIDNEIPLSRGLGSSGAAVIAGLVIANELAGAEMTSKGIAELATKIEGHPENVTASCSGGFSISCLANGNLYNCKIDPPENLRTVVVIPDISISTRAARQLLPSEVAFRDAVANVQRVGLMVGAIVTSKYSLFQEAVSDTLHQPYRKQLIPGFDEIIKAAYDAGAHAAFLSGSGSTLIAFVSEGASRVQEAMQAAANGFSYKSYSRILDIEHGGFQVHLAG